MNLSQYAFCEPVYATSFSPWHIRKLTASGRHLGGGADTLALCGNDVSWDLSVEVDPRHFPECCKDCVSALQQLMEND